MTQPALAQALFAPRAVALVGASADPKKNNSRVQRFLRQHGYAGRIVPVNPGRTEILGEPCFPDVRSIPGAIDHAFVMAPAAAVPDVIAQCGERGIPMATIFSAGFAELGEAGRVAQDRMVAAARAAGVRLLGPNCMGVINVSGGVALSVNAVLATERFERGPISVISQSGSMLGSLLTRAADRGAGFSRLVSVGNECDLGVGEIADLLVDDPDTGAILLFLETFRDADRLGRAARRAFAAGKPVIAYKLGRSDFGRELATSHTAALTTGDDVAEAFFRQHGILRVEQLETLYEIVPFVRGRRPPVNRGVAVLTGTGGAAAMVVDRLGALGTEVVRPTGEVIGRLAAQGITIGDALLTDIPMGKGGGGVYPRILGEFMRSEHCGAVVAVIGSSARNSPEVLAERILSAPERPKPLAVFLAPRADAAHRTLWAAGVASFAQPETCADAVRTYLAWRPPVEPQGPRDTAAAARLLAVARGERLDEVEAGRVFASLGVPVAESRVLASALDRADIGYPVVAKVLSADIAHKTELGGVELGLHDADALGRAAESLRLRFATGAHGRFDGILVQRQERGVAEVIVGFRRDPLVGPVVLVGLGGTLAEVYRDTVLRLAPVSVDTAREMIDAIRGLAPARGYRGSPRGDLEALAHAVAAFSQLACIAGRAVIDAEINPMIVRAEGQGVVAVDAKLVLEQGAGG